MSADDLPMVPSKLWSFDGQRIDTAGSLWVVRSCIDGGQLLTIRWRLIDESPSLTVPARRAVRAYIADRITRKKPSTVVNDFWFFVRFQRWLRVHRKSRFDWPDLDEDSARSFFTHAMRTADRGNTFSRLRTFYRWGVARRIRGFTPRMLRVLESITAVGNAKGHRVRFRDVLRGPFSPDELLLIRRAIVAGKGTDEDRAIVMLHLELGHNVLATVRLKNGNLIRIETSNAPLYQLDVPRIKKRTAGLQTKRRPISVTLGVLLESLKRGSTRDPLFGWLSAENPEDSVRTAMNRFSAAAGLVSPRTDKRLFLSPRRFRYSIATHMAEEGASIFHIAELLDHSDTQNVRVYVETASSIADPVAKATDSALAPLVERFQGKIVQSSALSGPEIIPATAPHLGLNRLDLGGIGFCGRDVRKDGLCRLFPPASCYLCPSFAAFRDGPHQQVLDSLERFLKSTESQNDPRIIAQLEDVRIGITEVITAIAKGSQDGCKTA